MRRPDAVALVDERGTLTFREVDERDEPPRAGAA